MANRTMAAKALKLRKQNRALPRSLSMNKRTAKGPNKEVLSEYQARVSNLGYDEANSWWIGLDGEITNKPIPGVPPGRKDVIDRTAEILQKFNSPLFIEHLSNPSRRVRIYFNSRQDECIIQEMHYLKRQVRLSYAFPNIDDCYFALKNGLIEWRVTKDFPDQSS